MWNKEGGRNGGSVHHTAASLQHQADIVLTSFVRELSGMTMDG
ncbi:MAG: hypothetical protein JWR00_98 [Rubritepida sp.]|nr:hypothetical protein [Rubritepida sp.]